jgi:hypothetical protein
MKQSDTIDHYALFCGVKWCRWTWPIGRHNLDLENRRLEVQHRVWGNTLFFLPFNSWSRKTGTIFGHNEQLRLQELEISRKVMCYLKFYVLLTALLGINFVNNQLGAQFFFMYVYFYSLHVSGSHVSFIRRINCFSTTSGICHSVEMAVWSADKTAICTQWYVPAVLIQLILLMMGTWLPETCRE